MSLRSLCVASILGFLSVAPSRAAVEEQVEVTASRTGFRPALVKLRKGETVRLVLKSADDEHCFALDALRIEKRIQAGRATTVDVTPDKPGTLLFYCCLEPDDARQRGKIVVSE